MDSLPHSQSPLPAFFVHVEKKQHFFVCVFFLVFSLFFGFSSVKKAGGGNWERG